MKDVVMQGYSSEKICEMCGGRIQLSYGGTVEDHTPYTPNVRQEQCVNDCYIRTIVMTDQGEVERVQEVYYPFKHYRVESKYDWGISQEETKRLKLVHHINEQMQQFKPNQWVSHIIQRQSEGLIKLLLYVAKQIPREETGGMIYD